MFRGTKTDQMESASEPVNTDAVVVDTDEPTTNLYNEPLKANNFIVNVTFQGTSHEVHINDQDYISDMKPKIHHKLKQHYPDIPAFHDTKILTYGIKKFCLMWEYDEGGKIVKRNTIEFNDDVDTITKTHIKNHQPIVLSILNDDELANLRDGIDQIEKEILMLEILCCPCITAGIAAACVVDVAAQAICCYFRKEMRGNTNYKMQHKYRPKSMLEFCLCQC